MGCKAGRCKTSTTEGIFIVIPSLEGCPTKSEEAPSPHEVRLAPLDTNPVFQSLSPTHCRGICDTFVLAFLLLACSLFVCFFFYQCYLCEVTGRQISLFLLCCECWRFERAFLTLKLSLLYTPWYCLFYNKCHRFAKMIFTFCKF